MRSTALARFAAIAAMVAVAAVLAIALPPAGARAADDADVSAWVGRYCTPTGCAGAPSSPIAHAASFGAAALAIGLLSRRRRA